MFKSGFTLTTDAHLDAAIFNRTPVVVWQNGVALDTGGQIEKHGEQTVTINGMHYIKAVCAFIER